MDVRQHGLATTLIGESMEAELLQSPFFVAVLGQPESEDEHRSIILFDSSGEMFVAAHRIESRNLEVGERLNFYTDSSGAPISWPFHGFENGKHIGHARDSRLKPLWEQMAKQLGLTA